MVTKAVKQNVLVESDLNSDYRMATETESIFLFVILLLLFFLFEFSI